MERVMLHGALIVGHGRKHDTIVELLNIGGWQDVERPLVTWWPCSCDGVGQGLIIPRVLHGPLIAWSNVGVAVANVGEVLLAWRWRWDGW